MSNMLWGWVSPKSEVRVSEAFSLKNSVLIQCSRPDCIIALDTCFIQKHNKQTQDPEHPHPYDIFIPESQVKAMEEYIERVWGLTRTSTKAKQKRKQPNKSQDDSFDKPELKVPHSVLDSCQDSFTAADEARTKCSIQFLDSTALLALVCHHNHVLWLVNPQLAKTSLPSCCPWDIVPLDWVVGGLYNIMCMIECTCCLWGFLDCYIDHMMFAVLWAWLAMPANLPPSEGYRLWALGWQRVWVTVATHFIPHIISTGLWSKSTTCFSSV